MTPLTNFFRKIFGGMAATAKNGDAAVSPCADEWEFGRICGTTINVTGLSGEMAEENSKECERLHAAYVEMRKEMSQPRFVALMEAFESDLKDDTFAYLPVADENVEAMRDGGQVKWLVLQTPKGKMIALFTSKDEVARHPSGNHVGIKMAAFVRAALGIGDCAGILINPLDGHHGIPIERRNLEVLVKRISRAAASRVPRLHPGVVSNAVYRLWEVAVGVPTPVYDVSKEVEALGGMEKILKPIIDGWAKRAEEAPEEFPTHLDRLKAVMKDVVSHGFVYGAMALKYREKALDADIDRCIDAIPNLRDDIGQNVDEYLTLLSDAARSDMVERNEEHLQLLLALNANIIAFGAFNFGLGWGMAKNAESEGVMVLAELRDRQQEWIENFKAEVLEKQRQAKEGKKDDENGK